MYYILYGRFLITISRGSKIYDIFDDPASALLCRTQVCILLTHRCLSRQYGILMKLWVILSCSELITLPGNVMPDLVFDLFPGIKHGFLSSSDAGLLLVQLRLIASEWSDKIA